jgi:hypothetical protein
MNEGGAVTTSATTGNVQTLTQTVSGGGTPLFTLTYTDGAGNSFMTPVITGGGGLTPAALRSRDRLDRDGRQYCFDHRSERGTRERQPFDHVQQPLGQRGGASADRECNLFGGHGEHVGGGEREAGNQRPDGRRVREPDDSILAGNVGVFAGGPFGGVQQQRRIADSALGAALAGGDFERGVRCSRRPNNEVQRLTFGRGQARDQRGDGVDPISLPIGTTGGSLTTRDIPYTNDPWRWRAGYN